MICLTREVRFAINDPRYPPPAGKPLNAYAGAPALALPGRFYTLAVTLRGEADPRTGYLQNIKNIDEEVRRVAIPRIGEFVAGGAGLGEARGLLSAMSRDLADAWPGCSLDRLCWGLTPLLSLTAITRELPMIRLSQKFEFAASHRLHNPDLSDDENRRCFGKCNNPHGHGHNYELQVTIAGGSEAAPLIELPLLEQIVAGTIIDPFDHKNLNVELPEFAELIPSVENIAKVIYRRLSPALANKGGRLASVTVWETTRTWCEYSE
jgi:6-pyruvoyltetrahydropterin/6-carboxytetrahydropterin synthase